MQVFERGITQDQVILMAARASRTENQDAIDTAIVGMLADPKEVCNFVTGSKQRMMIILLTMMRWLCLCLHEGTGWHPRSSLPAIQSY